MCPEFLEDAWCPVMHANVLDLMKLGVYTCSEISISPIKGDASVVWGYPNLVKGSILLHREFLTGFETMDRPKILDPVERCKEIGRSCACYHLRRTARAITRLYDDFLRPSGLRVTQYSVLIVTKSRGPVTLTKLAELTVTERTTLTRNLTILEKKGFISIEPGKDRRERQVTLTEQGQDMLMKAMPLWEAAQAHIENGLGEDRMDSLFKDLSEVISLTRNT